MALCPLCKSESVFDFETAYVKVYRCRNASCEHLFAGTVKPYSGVHEHEITSDFSPYAARDKALISYWQRSGFLKPAHKLLDFGSGTGHLLKALKSQMPTLDITAVEYNETYHGQYKAIARTVKELTALPANEQFDVITIIEVIEHLDDPIHILTSLKNRLRAGGTLFLSTPTGDFRKPFENRKNLDAYDSPYHIQFFTEKSLQYSLRTAGFQKIKYKYIDELYPNLDWGSFRSRLRIMKRYYSYWKGFAGHLTYFAS